MNYIENRQNPLSKTDIDEIDLAFQTIVDFFKIEWLKGQGAHVLQQLWRRRDWVATAELFTFGRSLQISGKASDKWLSHQVSQMLSDNKNNQIGATFEILLAGILGSKQMLVPAPISCPGFDFDIIFANSINYKISAKRYQKSCHEALFEQKSEDLLVTVKNASKANRVNVSIVIECGEYPDTRTWGKINYEIERVVRRFRGSCVTKELDNNVTLMVTPVCPHDGQTLSRAHTSYTVSIISRFHKNEQANFISKIETAVNNMEKHLLGNQKEIPIIVLGLPPSACTNTMVNWTREYLRTHVGCCVKAIMFLQPSISSNIDKKRQFISYHARLVTQDGFSVPEESIMNIEVPVGVMTEEQPKWRMILNDEDVNLVDSYVFQKGRQYVIASGDESNLHCKISNYAPGLETVGVITLGNQMLELNGIWGQELMLIGG